MNEQVGESLSALLDAEASDLDLQRVLNELENDADVVGSWRRYHLASAAMKNDLGPFTGVDLSAAIRAQLEHEAPDGRSMPVASVRRAWLKPVASVAVAASVTAAILTGTQLYTRATGGAAAPLAETLAANGRVGPVSALGQTVGFGAPSPAASAGAAAYADELRAADALAQRRLEAYLQQHLEATSLNTSNGLLPFARSAPREDSR